VAKPKKRLTGRGSEFFNNLVVVVGGGGGGGKRLDPQTRVST
jgi:hypothetical protein